MKLIKHSLLIFVLGIIFLDTHAQQSSVDYIADLLKGRWYHTRLTGGIGGVNETVTAVAGDSIIITRIPGTDSIAWKSYHNCLITEDLKYQIRWEYLVEYNTAFKMLVDSHERFVVDFIGDGFSMGYLDARDQFFYWYSHIDTFVLHPKPVITETWDDWTWRCQPGTIKLQAQANIGTINWYTTPAGDTAIATGESFIAPVLDSTTVYYVDATDNGCVTPIRTAVTARIADCTSGADSMAHAISGRWYIIHQCDGWGGCDSITPVAGDSTIFHHIPGTDSVTWNSYHNCQVTYHGKYQVAYGTSSLTGEYTWMLEDTGRVRYDVDFLSYKWFGLGREAYDAGGYRYSQIDTFTMDEPPVITGITDGSRCGSGEVILGAIADPGTINWYSVPTGDAAIATGNSFVTPVLTSTTVYYVDATYNGCTTLARTAITATISNNDSCYSIVNDPYISQKISIYPNPTSGKLEIAINESFDDDIQIELFNNLGSFIKKMASGKNQIKYSLDLSGYPSGLYFIRFLANKKTYQFKIIRK